MVTAKGVSQNGNDTLVLIGTMKGAFVLRSDEARTEWELGGPWFAGHSVYSMAYDDRNGRSRIWAATSSMHWGAMLVSTDDFGNTWSEPETAPIKFPESTGTALKQIWQIQPAGSEEPDSIFCGVEPAALFKSTNAGGEWNLVTGLYDHPDRPKWEPGGGGLCLHTILIDPKNSQRITVAISTGGVYQSEDGGSTWSSRNKGVRAQFLPEPYPEFGQCVHKIVQNSADSSSLFLQNHWGLYKSNDGGSSWSDIANGVPSDFGFAMAADPNQADTVYIVPIESDQFRCTPEGKLRVYKTEDAGASWRPLSQGLPQDHAFETVLRDGMSTDRRSPAGVYFGTRSGKVFGSNDSGETWSELADGLPPIVCVKTAIVR